MAKLEGKVAVITGGSEGIGLATAKEFKNEKAKVVIFGRDQEKLNKAATELGGDILTVAGDIVNRADVARLFETTEKQYGKIDVLFLNAGVAKAAPLEMVTDEIFDEMMEVNFKAPYFAIQKAVSFLNDNASIILNTSVSNQRGQHSLSVYAASKAALRTLARTLSAELLPRGIRVNAVSPGITHTPMLDKLGMPEDVVQFLASQHPLKRFAVPEEIARVALFLASSDSSYIVGTEITVDGGQTHLY